MAILQALLTLLGRSAGKVLNAIFGWAVRALFGQTSSREQTFLSAVVAAAVAWPVLLVGVAVPKIASFLLAFVPIPHWVPSWTIRLVWLCLAVLVPLGVGLTVAAKAPPHTPRESFLRRTARGFPITIGLTTAFLIMFVSVPVMRFVALVRRFETADVPLVTTAAAYGEVAERIWEVLARHGFGLRPAQPGWWVTAPIRILLWFGGEAFRAYVPNQLAHFVGPELELSLYPSGALLRGRKDKVTWAHGLIAETVAHGEGLQTVAPETQALEKELRRLWKIYDENPAAHAGSRILLARLDEITRALGELAVSFDDWQIIYRQILQVERAVRGERQLLEDEAPAATPGEAREGEGIMAMREPEGSALEGARTGTLVKELVSQVELLARKEVELAKVELRANLHKEAGVAGGLGLAAVTLLITITLLLVTAVLGLSLVLPGWAAGLIISGVTLAVTIVLGLVSWSRRVRKPMARTRETLKEDYTWARERLA